MMWLKKCAEIEECIIIIIIVSDGFRLKVKTQSELLRYVYLDQRLC